MWSLDSSLRGKERSSMAGTVQEHCAGGRYCIERLAVDLCWTPHTLDSGCLVYETSVRDLAYTGVSLLSVFVVGFGRGVIHLVSVVSRARLKH